MSENFHTVIELFSVELWQEIFEYFSGNELWYSFRGLNKRIDVILDQIMLHLNLKEKGSYEYFIENILPSMKIANIRSLYLNVYNEIRHLSCIYYFNSLIQLRFLSLDINCWFLSDSLTLWNQLSSLKYLRSLKIILWGHYLFPENCIEDKELIICSIFNNDYCPLLESFSITRYYCQERWKTGIPSLIGTTKPTNIKYLSIKSLMFSDLIKLLPALQNVILLGPNRQLDLDIEYNEHLPNKTVSIPLLPKCIRMKLGFSETMNFEHVEYILKQTPNLKYFLLDGSYHLLNAHKWELLLLVQCPKLIKLELICMGHINDDDDDNFDRAVDNFKQDCQTSTFWLERNVTIEDKNYSVDDHIPYVVVEFYIKKSEFYI